MERARRLAAEGRRVLLLCYNRGLAAYLKTSPKASPFRPSIRFAMHCLSPRACRGQRYRLVLTRRHSGVTRHRPSFSRRWIDSPTSASTPSSLTKRKTSTRTWWIAVEKLLRRPKEDVLWVFFDPQQNIYGGSAWEALGLRTAPLSYNCRNTQRIARYAYGLVQAEPKLRAGTPEGVEVSVEQCTGEREMLDAVRRALHRIVVEGRLSPDRVVVLSPHSARTSAVWRTQKFGNLRLVEYPAAPAPERFNSPRYRGSRAWRQMRSSSARRARGISTRRSSTSMWRRQGRGTCLRWPSKKWLRARDQGLGRRRALPSTARLIARFNIS